MLQRPAQAGSLDCRFVASPAIKDTIEATGIPHTEVDLIFVNGRPVDFSYRLQPNDSVDVYPVESLLPRARRAYPLIHLSPPAPEPVRFVLDVHLGTLTRRLRLLGFDSLYRNDSFCHLSLPVSVSTIEIPKLRPRSFFVDDLFHRTRCHVRLDPDLGGTGTS